MTRRERIANSFIETFEAYKKQNIVIYGTGEYATWIGETFGDYNIVGYLDRWKSNGEVCGKPILSYKDIKDKHIDIIIIAANNINTENVRSRIAGYCNDLGIRLYSLEGILLNNPIESVKDLNKFQNLTGLNVNEILSMSRFFDCEKYIGSNKDKIYWDLIKKRYFVGNYNIDILGRLHICEPYDIGYLFFGPIVTDFLLWLVRLIEDNKITSVYFSARDGYLLQKLYETLRRRKDYDYLPQSVYLYTSRYVCMMSELYCEEDIIKCADIFFDGSLEEMLQNRFMLNVDELFFREENAELSNLEYVLLHKEIILEKAAVIRENYNRYLEQQNVGMDSNALFFDLAASGTCQKVIEKIRGVRLIGAYMLRMLTADVEKQELRVVSYHEYDDNFALHSMIMECILTSLQPTLCYIDSELHPVFSTETRNGNEIIFVEKAQSGIYDYFSEVLNVVNSKEEYTENILPKILFNHITSYYTSIDNDTFESYTLKDEILNLKNSIYNKYMV